ncbi:MAG: hypothetical protein ACW97Z_04365 [Candidatus Hodarchaeales archaeon]|jgi:hypothetical protein
MSSKETFTKLMEHFLAMSGVKKQGNSLKKNRKMFAMFTKEEEFVVKLSEGKVKKLINSGEGLPYDPGTGKHMKEWVTIPEASLEIWINYAQEAMEFVTS